jgi:hypothetical protein
MGQICNSWSHVCYRIFANFGLAKRLWSCTTCTAATSGSTTHEVSADLPNAQNATAASDLPQANVTASQTTEKPSVNQQLISVKLIFIIFGLIQKVVILSVLNC